jgi:nitroimidazol reductase NimA-like FMN-containing flavoprotein (pyridoxamine 5'-phosphate oxidase superfamily)
MTATDYSPTPHTTLHRIPARASYDRGVVHAILDEALVCHIGFVHEGLPVVIPTTFVRDGEQLFVHGAAASRMLKVLASGTPVGVTVTLVDGLVLARTAFHHSMNYRSVAVIGTAHAVEDPTQKRKALRKLIEKVAPGRELEVREPNDKELAATSVLAVPLAQVSAKIRTGMPKAEDDPADAVAPVWAGVIPLEVRAGMPVPENEGAAAYAVPALPTFVTRTRPRS